MNLPPLRASDVASAVRTQRARPSIRRLLAQASGVAGWWAPYPAAHEKIDRIWLDRTPHSIRAAFDLPVHEGLHDAVIPDVIYRPPSLDGVLWTDPTDWTRNVVKLDGKYLYGSVAVQDDARRFIDLFLQPRPAGQQQPGCSSGQQSE